MLMIAKDLVEIHLLYLLPPAIPLDMPGRLPHQLTNLFCVFHLTVKVDEVPVINREIKEREAFSQLPSTFRG